MAESASTGAKTRDYPWTVFAVDPLAVPVTRWLARRRLLSPDQVTYLSLALGLSVGICFALGRAGLIVGGLVFYLSFVLDCVDGKLARIQGSSSERGRALDAMADGARRASAAIGLGVALWRLEPDVQILWLAVFAVLSFYFMEISGAERAEPADGARGRWSEAMARHRLLPTPGMPDVSAIVYVLGPISGLVVPALAVGIVMVAAGIAVTYRRRLRMDK